MYKSISSIVTVQIQLDLRFIKFITAILQILFSKLPFRLSSLILCSIHLDAKPPSNLILASLKLNNLSKILKMKNLFYLLLYLFSSIATYYILLLNVMIIKREPIHYKKIYDSYLILIVNY